jgi:4-aminobutyrate aminotransferase-like enzyme
MGEAGLVAPPEGWLSKVQAAAHERDALLIVDEVQAGYGRTGEMWGVDHYDVVPDIMPQAKGIANGLPLGAFTAREEIADAFESGDHLSTFGGNPVACAAADATIDALQDGIIDNARGQGEWLGEELAALESEYDVVGEGRGLGLMRGLELVHPDGDTGPMDVAPEPAPKFAKKINDHLREEGIIMGVGGFHKNVMRFQPPLTISQDQLQEAIEALRNALDTVSA